MKITFLTGAGISAPSGIPTFRHQDGMWLNHSIEDVATTEAFQKDPRRVIDFWNDARSLMHRASPNDAHRAIAALDSTHEITVITQNIDDLHERAGSKCVVHLHGNINYAIGVDGRVFVGHDVIPYNMKPDVVLFGDPVPEMEFVPDIVKEADVFIIVGTSLDVFPANSLVKRARYTAKKYIVDLNPSYAFGYARIAGDAAVEIPKLLATIQ